MSSFVKTDVMFCEMMLFALRYALGRRTYAVSDVVNYLIPLIPSLTDKVICCMERDIGNAFIINNVGDQCDAKEWNKLLSKITEEIESRGVEHWK